MCIIVLETYATDNFAAYVRRVVYPLAAHCRHVHVVDPVLPSAMVVVSDISWKASANEAAQLTVPVVRLFAVPENDDFSLPRAIHAHFADPALLSVVSVKRAVQQTKKRLTCVPSRSCFRRARKRRSLSAARSLARS